jgi:hypothetical protein
MSIRISPRGEDDPGFIDKVNRVLGELVQRHRPRDVYVVQVEDAFGDRWCGTGGRFLGERQAQTVVSREAPRLPPFDPDRIATEEAYRLALDFTSYLRAEDAERLHVHGLQGREYQRELSMFTEAGLFLWYSGGTSFRDRGTMMVQIVTPEYTDVWHATLARESTGWEFRRGMGVAREDFEAY